MAISFSSEPRVDNLCLLGTRSFASWSIPVCLCISKAMLDIIYIGLQEKALLQARTPKTAKNVGGRYYL